MKALIIGSSSNLSISISNSMLQKGIEYSMVGREGPDFLFDASELTNSQILNSLTCSYDAYIINYGLLYSKTLLEQSNQEIADSLGTNLISVVRISEIILKENPRAKVYLIGSESGQKGSYDTTYFLAKAALRAYVRERRINSPLQQLLLFSPSTIIDAGMTLMRADRGRINEYAESNPKKRLLSCAEVANIIVNYLSDDFSYITNSEIEINGGKFARMVMR